MNLPARVQEIIDLLYAKNKSLAYKEDDQRKLTKMIAEQIAYEFGPEWGLKSADSNRPQSPSNLAYQSPTEGLVCWRWLDGDGSISGTPFGVAHPPVFASIPGQNFISVDPINHLFLNLTQNPIINPSPTSDLRSLTDEIGRLSTNIGELHKELDGIKDELAMIRVKLDRRYVSKIFGATIISRPE